MKTACIPVITKWWLVLILVLVLLPCVAVAKDAATLLDQQLIEAAARGELALVKTILDKGADSCRRSNVVPYSNAHASRQANAEESTDSGAARPSEISIKDLEGIWVPQDSLEKLHKFLEPFISQPVEIVIRAAGDGKSFKLEYASFYWNAKPLFDLLALHRTEQPDEWELQLKVAQKEDHFQWPEKIRIKLERGSGDCVAGITFLSRELVPFCNERFIRVPIPWSQYVNRLVFAGTWKDEIGQVFSFNESGTGHGPGGQSFTYNVPLSRIGATRDTIRVTPSNALEPSGAGEYCFIRFEDGLIFYRTWPDHVCSGDPPILTLKRE